MAHAMTVLDRMGQNVLSKPDFVALVFEDERVTYQQLDDRATRIAQALIAAGLQSETLVGVLLNRSVNLVAAMLGIWKAGGVYVPLDPSYPPDRLAFMVRDSEVQFLLSESGIASPLPPNSAQVIFCDNLADLDQASLQSYAPLTSQRDRIAYVVYTSGSSGNPKGVAIGHYGLLNVVSAISEELELGTDDVVLASATISFDISILEVLLPLITGARGYIVDRECAVDGKRMIGKLRVSGATVVLGTPTSWRLLLEAGWQGNTGLQIVSGGESLPVTLAQALSKLSRKIWNHYGPTEATICSTTELANTATDKITIGRPLANIRVHVLKQDLLPVPVGEVGEMYIGGAGVGQGYINRPELNEACFLTDPFVAIPDARMYKTGDLARVLPDGRLEFLGRVDSQIKIRGYRIELQEIEETIQQYVGVQAAAVQAIEVAANYYRLVAYVVSASGRPLVGLHEFLVKTLPVYMLPSEVVAIQSLPVSPNGKVDREALKESYLKRAVTQQNIDRPADQIEARLKSIWERLLKKSPIGTSESFFTLGGDSLLAARMLVEIERTLHSVLPLSILVGSPTIRELAAILRKGDPGRDWPGLVTIQPGTSLHPLFVVHGVGGSLLSFRSLAAEMGFDQSVYGLQRSAAFATSRVRPTLQGLASNYVDEIRSIDPDGPYNLAGHSSGGLVAYEMATQLLKMGKAVNFLGLLDCDYQTEATRQRSFVASHNHILHHAKLLTRQWRREGTRAIMKRKLSHENIMMKYRILSLMPRDQQFLPRIFGHDAYLAFSAKQYVPQTYPGNVVLFIAEESRARHRHFGAGWAAVVKGDLEIVNIPGTHQTMLNVPNVSFLGHEVRRRMQPL